MKATAFPSTVMDEHCSIEGAKGNSLSAGHYLPEFINPQHTDKLFSTDGRMDHSFTTPRIPHGLPSPFPTTSAPVSPSSPLESDGSHSYSFEITSTPSMNSSPGYPTPSSSNTSSRRHSLISPDSHQSFFVAGPGAESSPTPGVRRLRNHNGQQVYHGGLHKQFQVLADSMIAVTDPFHSHQNHSAPDPEAEIIAEATLDWPYGTGIHHHHHPHQQDSTLPINMHSCLGLDLTADFDASMCGQLADNGKPKSEGSTVPSFITAPARYRPASNQAQVPNLHNISPTILAAPYEPTARLPNHYPQPQSLDRCVSRQARKHGSSSLKRRKPPRKSEPPWRAGVVERQRVNGHRCSECGLWFRRPEHLKRHVRKHLPTEETNLLRCHFFPECTQNIKDRKDNLRAHLNSTHFKYGKTERGGKNKRYSMQETMRLGLRDQDPRWTLLLEGQIMFGDTENGYWKMLGYSIKETDETRVKDIIPECDLPDEVTLKHFDPRWKKLLDGDMTFEQAMEKGTWMKEEESEGLLGVDMKTTEMMGLKKLDPRWRKLLEGSMSIETSDKLGVTHLNPICLAQQP